MMPGFRSALLLGVVLLALPAMAQSARKACPEGRTFSGECVEPDAVADARKDALMATQNKLSMTAPQLMPGDPDAGRYRYNYAETKAFFIDPLRPPIIRGCLAACPAP